MKIDIIGRGNVASHLLTAMSGYEDLDCRIVNPRSFDGLRRDASVYLLAVADDAIAEVCGRLCSQIGTMRDSGYCDGLNPPVIAHTSGTTPLSALDDATECGFHVGVFYPLQTFSKGIKLDYPEIPIFIEGDSDFTYKRLAWIACPFGETMKMDSVKRRALHLASVVACNFANRLWALADEYLAGEDIDFRLMLPLLRETVGKLERVSHPRQAQTGPAERHDMRTISRHLKMLESKPELKGIYQTLTNSILND